MVAFILLFSFNIVGAVEPKVGDINSVAKPITNQEINTAIEPIQIPLATVNKTDAK